MFYIVMEIAFLGAYNNWLAGTPSPHRQVMVSVVSFQPSTRQFSIEDPGCRGA
jgi:hypothetical protein